MSKAAQLMVMLISLGAPRRSKLANFFRRHATWCIHARRSMKLCVWHRNAHIAPQIWAIRCIISKKVPPLLRRQLQMRGMGSVANKLIMAAKDIFRRSNILVETQEYCSFVLVAIVSVQRQAAWTLVGSHAANAGR